MARVPAIALSLALLPLPVAAEYHTIEGVVAEPERMEHSLAEQLLPMPEPPKREEEDRER